MAPFHPVPAVLLVGLIGCDTAPPAVPTPASPSVATAGPLPDKPDLLRLGYDPSARLLTLYELPDRGGRWLLVTPDQPAGTPVSGTVAVPADPDAVSLFYTVPARRPSPRVTLREIADARVLHARR